MEKEYFDLGLSNYYGTLYAVDNMDGTYHLELEDYSGTKSRRITKDLFKLITTELEIK